MRIPTLNESLEGWKKARQSKIKITLFCFFGFVCGIGVHSASYLPVPSHLQNIESIVKAFYKYFGLFLSVLYGGALVFFAVSFFTNIWERLCDAKIKKFQEQIASSTNQDDSTNR